MEAINHLATGTYVNAKDVVGETPLHLAVIGGHKGIVELLIAEGADVGAKANDGKTPLDWAINPVRSQTEIANLLRKHGGKHSISGAAAVGNIEAVKQALNDGADVNVQRPAGTANEGDTPLDFAVEYKRTETADFLRKHGGKTGAELKADQN